MARVANVSYGLTMTSWQQSARAIRRLFWGFLGFVALAIALIVYPMLLVDAASAGRDPALLRARAFVDKRCPAQYREISTRMWGAGLRFNALYGNCRAGDGRDQHVWFFDRGRFLGTDAAKSSHWIIGAWRDDKTIAFLYVLYRPSDPECCPTGGAASVRFRWTGKRIKRLDPLPPRAFAPGVAVGR